MSDMCVFSLILVNVSSYNILVGLNRKRQSLSRRGSSSRPSHFLISTNFIKDALTDCATGAGILETIPVDCDVYKIKILIYILIKRI